MTIAKFNQPIKPATAALPLGPGSYNADRATSLTKARPTGGKFTDTRRKAEFSKTAKFGSKYTMGSDLASARSSKPTNSLKHSLTSRGKLNNTISTLNQSTSSLRTTGKRPRYMSPTKSSQLKIVAERTEPNENLMKVQQELEHFLMDNLNESQRIAILSNLQQKLTKAPSTFNTSLIKSSSSRNKLATMKCAENLNFAVSAQSSAQGSARNAKEAGPSGSLYKTFVKSSSTAHLAQSKTRNLRPAPGKYSAATN